MASLEELNQNLPGRVELDDPDALAVDHAVLEVVGVEVDHAGALAVQRGGGVRHRREDGERRGVEELHPETPGVTRFSQLLPLYFRQNKCLKFSYL